MAGRVRVFMRDVENRLGWVPQNKHARRATERKVQDKIQTNPELYTARNLNLALELLVREKTQRSPLGVIAHVERAVAMARDTTSDLEAKIAQAVRYETGWGDKDGWATRFARSSGVWREATYREWLDSREKNIRPTKRQRSQGES